MAKTIGDVEVSDAGNFVALVEIQRGPNNFFDQDLICNLADAFNELDDDDILSLCDIAEVFACSKRTIERAVEKGDIPPSVRTFGKQVWSVGAIRSHLKQRLSEAAEERERFMSKIGQPHRPRHAGSGVKRN